MSSSSPPDSIRFTAALGAGSPAADRGRWEIVKGILVLVVIAGHNEAVAHACPPLRQVFYFFNVPCFFLLSSLLDRPRCSAGVLADRAVRYLVPYALTLGLAWLAGLPLRGLSASLATLPQLARALVTGGESAIHAAVGLRYLWFLPALFSLVAFKVAAAAGPRVHRLLVGLATVWIVTAALVPREIRAALPLGASEGLFFFGLGELFHAAVTRSSGRLLGDRAGARAALVVGGLAAVIVAVPLGWVAAANVGSYDIRQPLTWAVGLLFPCAMLPALGWLAGFGRGRQVGLIPGRAPLRPGVQAAGEVVVRAGARLCAAFGRHSLAVYLAHMLVYRGLTRAWFGPRFGESAVVGGAWSAGLVILGITAAGSLLLALGLERLPRLEAIVLPRNWLAWRRALGGASA